MISEYEKKLERLRNRADRTSVLEERLRAKRNAGLAQREREVALSGGCDEGTDAAYARVSEDHEEAIDRVVRIAGVGAVQDCRSQIRPAISFSTWIPSLDIALGGGIPCGLTEVFGTESVGKSTLVMEMIRSAQLQKRDTALCPTEVFDWKRARDIGVNCDELLVIRGQDERVLSAASEFVTGGDNRILFIDSATGIRPEEGSWWLAMLAWFEDVAGKMSSNSGIVMTNQVRVRRSVDPRRFFAGGTDSTAHRIASYFDTRMELTRENVTEETYDLVINLVANLYSAPHKIVTLPVVKVQGIDVWKDVVRVAAGVEILQERAAHFYYAGEHLGHGEETTARRLEKDSSLGSKVFRETLQAMSCR
jgi:GTPase SAR1 family protein